MPALGNSFDLIDWGGPGGGNLSGLHQNGIAVLASGLKWDTSQLYISGVLAVGVGIPGDFNQDGLVDARDYVVGEKLGTPYTQADYNAWRTHFGRTSASAASSLWCKRGPRAAVPFLLTAVLSFVFVHKVIANLDPLTSFHNEIRL